MIQVKRIYEAPHPSDGRRVLIDRIWARGLTKEKAKVDIWMKAIAPSHELRRWYGHAPEKWPEFKAKYTAELDANPSPVDDLLREVRNTRVTLLFSSKELKLNNATALKEYLESKLEEPGQPATR